MEKKNKGHILNVASIAGFMPGPLMATYYASKNYVLRFSQAIKEELKKVEQNIEEIYQDKISKVIQLEDFKVIYEKMQKQRDKVLKEIRQTENALNQNNEQTPQIDFLLI